MCTIIKVVSEGFTVEDVKEELAKLHTSITVRNWGFDETKDQKLIVEISEINNHCLCDIDEHEAIALVRFIELLSRCNI